MTNLWHQFQSDYKDKRVLILGLGLQGRGLSYTKLLAEVGAKLTISDLKTESELASSLLELKGTNLRLLLGGHHDVALSEIDVVFRNPSVPVAHPLLNKAREMNIPIKMDTSLYFAYAKPKLAIGITGTRGKSTTTALIHHGLVASGHKALKCGNIAPESMLELLKTPPDPDTYLVTELSSWQLQGFHDERVSPHISVLTNLYEDHLLDRSFEEYQFDKSAIFAYQTPQDWLVTNRSNVITTKISEAAISKVLFFDASVPINSKLSGEHNQENLAAAMTVLKIVGVDQPSILSDFEGLPYRQQVVREVDGIRFINDTTSTTPIATIKAVSTFPQSIVILGGSTKRLPVEDLIQTLNEQAALLILIAGSGTEEIKPNLNQAKIAGEYQSLTDAVKAAKQLAAPGQTVLFSPGFTSFGLFQNEFDRGRQFNQIVESL